METIVEVREGDIFLWTYRDPGDDRQWGRYHCCSRIAIADSRGRLRDTYWSGADGRTFGPDDFPRLELKYLGNLSELETVKEYEANYYDDADIVDLNHSNSTRGNFYLRKGAQRSAKKMIESAQRKLEQAELDERMAVDRANRLREAIARFKTGDISGYF